MPGEEMLAAGIAQGVGGILSGIAGIGQRTKGNRLLKKIGEETVPTELIENRNLAKQQAATGLPSEQYAKAMKSIQRQQLMALRGAHDRRGGLGILPIIQQTAGDASLNLDAADAQMKLANQRYAMGINERVGGFKNKIWERKYNYGMGLLGMGNQNLYGGLDKLGAGLGYGITGLRGGGRTGKTDNANYQGDPYVPGYAPDFDDYGQPR
jgi:hypothetical protein